MLVWACSAAVNGIEAYAVEFEVNSAWGETIIVILGQPFSPPFRILLL
jgi:hypothetical protein